MAGNQAAQRRVQVMYGIVGFMLGCLFLTAFSGNSKNSSANSKQQYTLPSALEDAIFLGPQTGNEPPARLDDYKYKTTAYQEVYDKSWTQTHTYVSQRSVAFDCLSTLCPKLGAVNWGGYPRQSCWGCRFGSDVVARLPFHSLLDAGTGNAQLVRLMRSHGKSAWGIELSQAVLEAEAPDLLKEGYVEAGVLTNLPFANNTFDLVFSADVLEHIHPEEADKVVSELVRVSRRHILLSISLKPHTKVSAMDNAEANRHTMLRPRGWWEAKFAQHGAAVNRELLWALQERDTRYTKETMTDCRQAGDSGEGGKYEVCVVDNTWLVGRREQANVRKDRCITTENSELEPWFFSFRKLR